MAVNQAFESILNHVQSSCLNFKIEISPFSAVIHLKKSFIKNQNGETILPPEDIVAEKDVVVKQLEEEKNDLQIKLMNAKHESKTCHEALDNLKEEIVQKEKRLESLVKRKADTGEEI